MSRRQIFAGCIGMIIGLVMGMLLVSVDIVDLDLSGGAVKPDHYYLVELSTAVEWLQEAYFGDGSVDEDDSLILAIDTTLELPPWREVWDAFPDAKASIQMVLETAHEILAEVEKGDDERDGVSTCLGLDDNPYREEGPAMYLYVQVPNRHVDDVTIPEDWPPPLTEPKDSIFWLLLSCYPDDADEAR